MSMYRSFAARGCAVALAALAALSGCGGGGGSTGTSTSTGTGTTSAPAIAASAPVAAASSSEATPAAVASAKTALHSAALGVLVGAKVEVRNAFDKTATVLYATTTDTNGQFSVAMPDYTNYAMFLVTVSGGNDWDVADTGKRDAAPTAFNGSINALVDPKDMILGSISVSLLSDAAYRLIGGDLASFDASSLNTELNRIARVLLKTSLLGGSSVASADLLHFDATSTAHRAALAFDFASLAQPIDQGGDTTSILDKYHAGSADVVRSWRVLTAAVAGVAPTMAQELNKTSAKLQVGVSGTGRIMSAALPGGQLDRTPAPYAAVVPRDASTLSFDAVETDAAWKFDSWVGCTAVAGKHCEVTMSQDTAVSARFALATPVMKATTTSLGRLAPQDGVTGVRFNDDGTATVVTRDAATVAFLNTVTAGSFIQTGHADHPTVKVSAIVAGPTSVSAGGAAALPVTTLTVRYDEASPVDVYDSASIVFDSAPAAFDEVRAITLGDGVGGTVRTVLPVPDFTSSVVAATVLGTPPSWYVTFAADGRSCRGYGADAVARAALQAAWQAAPRTYPFTASALGNCISLGNFSLGGDLTDYVMGKSTGETDLFSGRNDGTGKLSMRLPEAGGAVPGSDTRFAQVSKGQAIERRAEPVWIAGVGVAVPLGNHLFLAAQEHRKGGFRLVALQDTVKITTAQAIRRAESDCSLKGLDSACGLVAGLERERQGLRTVGSIPLLSTPLAVTLEKKGSNFSGTVTLNLNLDISPKAKWDYSVSGLWVSADVGADYQIAPELGLTAMFGGPVETFKVPRTSKKKKFDKTKSKAKTDSNKIETSKTALTVDVGRLAPEVGAVLDLSLNLVIGIDIGGDVSVTVTPKLTMKGDFGVHAYYKYHLVGANDEDISPYFHMPTRQPSVTGEMKGELFVEPYMEVNLAAGIRKVAPQVARIYARAGIEFKGEVATGFSYATKFRDGILPGTYAEGKVNSKSSKYYESCDLETRSKDPSSCTCTNDEVKVVTTTIFGQTFKFPVVTAKCVQRGDPVYIPGKKGLAPQICVNDPELALGVYGHLKAGIAISSEHIMSPAKKWLSFINKDVTLLEKELPIWEYPAKDDEDDSDLTGCHDIK